MDSFERNLENAQMDAGVEGSNFIPVIYKTEIEAASLTGILPTILIIGFLLYMMRRSAEMMGGARGGKRGGIFGSVMESTAKLINSADIGIRFKCVLRIRTGCIYLRNKGIQIGIVQFLGMWLGARKLKLKSWSLSIFLKIQTNTTNLGQRFPRVPF